MVNVDVVTLARERRALPPPGLRREIRRAAGISTTELAAQLGVSRQAVAKWETSDRTPRGPMLLRYAEILRQLSIAA